MTGLTGLNILNVSDDELRALFNRDIENRNRWMMFTFTSDCNLALFHTGIGWETVQLSLQPNSVSYVICNLSYISPTDNIARDKTVFVMWAPETAPIKDRLKATMYNREAQRLLSSGRGFQVVMQANEVSDANLNHVMEKIRKNSYTL